jgi:Holliday junction DNA helicase RuvA
VIGRLSGVLLETRPPQLLLDVGGVGYEVEAPMSTFYTLPAPGQPVVLHTHLQVREDAHLLYGFASLAERELFRALLKVSGVGGKMALAILSGMNAAVFARCVQDGDAAALTRLPGVGKKTAERLIVEMRDRVAASDAVAAATPGAAVPQAPGNPVEDAVHALVALGYKAAEASRMIRGVDAEGLGCEEIIRRALKDSLR